MIGGAADRGRKEQQKPAHLRALNCAMSCATDGSNCTLSQVLRQQGARGGINDPSEKAEDDRADAPDDPAFVKPTFFRHHPPTRAAQSTPTPTHPPVRGQPVQAEWNNTRTAQLKIARNFTGWRSSEKYAAHEQP